MARLSRTRFPIYEDPTVTTSEVGKSDYTPRQVNEEQQVFGKSRNDSPPNATEHGAYDEEDEACGDAPADTEPHRESSGTRVSISSMPDSMYPTDGEYGGPMHEPYDLASGRPVVRTTDAFYRPAPRQRTPGRLKTGAGTPTKAVRSRLHQIRPLTVRDNETEKHYPLVLLHINLLPARFPWSDAVLQKVLPMHVRQDLQLLQDKADDIVRNRGILIRHPRAEFDLLEERLLEALDLRSQRITADGHFVRTDHSTDLSVSKLEEAEDRDSGLGSSEDGSDNETCSTCAGHSNASRQRGTSPQKKWNIKVFAANGLIRASAWAACWSEMERVDVEISPCLPEDLKRRLDEQQDQESSRHYTIKNAEKLRGLHEEQVSPTFDEATRTADIDQVKLAAPGAGAGVHLSPSVYKSSQVPISLLIRNYLYVLAQDPRNIAIVLLSLMVIRLGWQAFPSEYLFATSSKLVPEQSAATRISCGKHQLSQSVDAGGHDQISSTGLGTLTVSSLVDATTEPLTTLQSLSNAVEDHGGMGPSLDDMAPPLDGAVGKEAVDLCRVQAFHYQEIEQLMWPSCSIDAGAVHS